MQGNVRQNFFDWIIRSLSFANSSGLDAGTPCTNAHVIREEMEGERCQCFWLKITKARE